MAYIDAPALTAPDASLPTLANYTSVIGGNSAVRAWLCPDTSRLTLAAGRVATAAGRAAAGVNYTQADTSKQPIPLANAINGRQALSFVNARNDLLVAPGAVNVTGDFGFVAVLRSPAYVTPALTRTILSLGVVGGSRFTLTSNSDERLLVSVGATGTAATFNTAAAFLANQWLPIIVSWNSTTKTVSMSIDGGLTWPYTATNASAAQPANGDLYVGQDSASTAQQGWTGDIADLIPLSLDPKASANAGMLTTLQSYLSDRYLLPV